MKGIQFSCLAFMLLPVPLSSQALTHGAFHETEKKTAAFNGIRIVKRSRIFY